MKFSVLDLSKITKPVRKVRRVFLHCSASDNPAHDHPKVIDEWHRHRTPPFRCIGYHFYIDKQGQVWNGRDIEVTPSAQVGNNTATIAICTGGLRSFTPAQLDAVARLCIRINTLYEGKISFHGHCEVSSKECPVFDYKKLLGLDEHGFIQP